MIPRFRPDTLLRLTTMLVWERRIALRATRQSLGRHKPDDVGGTGACWAAACFSPETKAENRAVGRLRDARAPELRSTRCAAMATSTGRRACCGHAGVINTIPTV